MSTDKVSTPKLVSGKVRRNLPNGSIDFISLEETEKYLGVPSTNGYVLASTTSGVRSWVAMSQGGDEGVWAGSGRPDRAETVQAEAGGLLQGSQSAADDAPSVPTRHGQTGAGGGRYFCLLADGDDGAAGGQAATAGGGRDEAGDAFQPRDEGVARRYGRNLHGG